jgi:uncharacterized protein YciI
MLVAVSLNSNVWSSRNRAANWARSNDKEHMSHSMQFLMLGNLPADAFDSDRHPNIKDLMREEQAHAKKSYMDGSIRQIWLQSPGPGAVAILEANSLEDARKLALSFPLAQAGLLTVNVIALTPYAGFGAG